MQTVLELQGVGSFVAGAEVVVFGMERKECKGSFVFAATCRRAARSSPVSCELMCYSFSESCVAVAIEQEQNGECGECS